MVQARAQLLQMYQAALDRVAGESCVRQRLSEEDLAEQTCLVAVGKAAAAMALGVCNAGADQIDAGLVITREGYHDPGLDRFSQIHCIESSHPVPDQRSLDAGRQLLDFLAAHAGKPLLFLLSGGTSSLVEVLHDHISLDELQAVNEWLLSNELGIHDINAVRKQLSQIKGGGLLQHIDSADVRAWLISDVPGDHPAIIGSGLLFPEQPVTDHLQLPDWINDLMLTTSGGNVADACVDILAANHHACEAAADVAAELGFATVVSGKFLEADIDTVLSEILAVLEQADAGVYIWGAECHLRLPPNPGRGGRCQQLALKLAQGIAGRKDIQVLVATTDGSDGNSGDAGAIVDGDTVSRGEQSGFSADASLAAADAGSFLEEAGDIIHTGPTGSNVMDLVIAVKY